MLEQMLIARILPCMSICRLSGGPGEQRGYTNSVISPRANRNQIQKRGGGARRPFEFMSVMGLQEQKRTLLNELATERASRSPPSHPHDAPVVIHTKHQNCAADLSKQLANVFYWFRTTQSSVFAFYMAKTNHTSNHNSTHTANAVKMAFDCTRQGWKNEGC